ncbi:hypothetical protein [Aliiglaciecola lipolytica]|uniref:hypothetical protein n=1 Tax=Aliiglaciecola lipolytica TaxID=477689 RepID=UPI00058B1022|nr:hypothetical protein [Aliiglaciecola lipolytica]
MEYRVAFEFVIGLSIEEPFNRRTTAQPTLVAAKVWASLYPSSKKITGEFRDELSIQTNIADPNSLAAARASPSIASKFVQQIRTLEGASLRCIVVLNPHEMATSFLFSSRWFSQQ